MGAALLAVLPPIYMAFFTADQGVITLPGGVPERAGGYGVWVADWGYHTGIIVEQPSGWRLGPPGEEACRYVEYAWGDRSFYMESNYGLHRLFGTVFLATESVAFVRSWDRPPSADQVDAVFHRSVDAAALEALIRALEAGFLRSDDGARAAAFPPTDDTRGRFYPARDYYLFWNDCNAWTVDCLAEAGIAGSSVGVVFAGQVDGRLKGFTEGAMEDR